MSHHTEQIYFFLFVLFAMARCAAAPVDVSTKHRRRLEAIVRQRHAPQSLVIRARVILMAGAGVGVRETARELGIGRATGSGVRQEAGSGLVIKQSWSML